MNVQEIFDLDWSRMFPEKPFSMWLEGMHRIVQEFEIWCQKEVDYRLNAELSSHAVRDVSCSTDLLARKRKASDIMHHNHRHSKFRRTAADQRFFVEGDEIPWEGDPNHPGFQQRGKKYACQCSCGCREWVYGTHACSWCFERVCSQCFDRDSMTCGQCHFGYHPDSDNPGHFNSWPDNFGGRTSSARRCPRRYVPSSVTDNYGDVGWTGPLELKSRESVDSFDDSSCGRKLSWNKKVQKP